MISVHSLWNLEWNASIEWLLPRGLKSCSSKSTFTFTIILQKIGNQAKTNVRKFFRDGQLFKRSTKRVIPDLHTKKTCFNVNWTKHFICYYNFSATTILHRRISSRIKAFLKSVFFLTAKPMNTFSFGTHNLILTGHLPKHSCSIPYPNSN